MEIAISLQILDTPEAQEWRELIQECGFTIADFCKHASSLFDPLSLRDHREVEVPGECKTLKTFDELLKKGKLDFLTAEERVVLFIALKMRLKREEKLDTPISTLKICDKRLRPYGEYLYEIKML